MKRKIKLYCLLLRSWFINLTHSKKGQKNVAILVSKKWKNKVSDDILLKIELLKNNINAKLVTWDEKHNYKKYDLIIVKSIWGYEKNIEKFEKLLEYFDEEKIQILNSTSIMKKNYDKEYQFDLLDKYNIPHIKTTFIKPNSNLEKEIKKIKEKEFVIKPCISASGGNTSLVSNNSNRNNCISISEIKNKYENINKTKSLMVQPFIKEIDNGEISLIYINGTFTHAVIRYPNVFNNKSGVKYIDNKDLDPKMFDLAKGVLKIKEYQKNLYERIDMVCIDGEYKIMEIELVEPALFINNITDAEIKEYVLHKLAIVIRERLQ